MFRCCLSLCMLIVFIGCQPNNEDPPRQRKPIQTSTRPTETERRLEYLRSFAGRTENYDMLGIQESKDWLRKNKYTVTEVGGSTLLFEQNYVSGNLKQQPEAKISKGFKGIVSVKGITKDAYLTKDDEGNIRIGFSRKE